MQRQTLCTHCTLEREALGKGLGSEGDAPCHRGRAQASRAEISALRAMEEKLRGFIHGGFDAALAADGDLWDVPGRRDARHGLAEDPGDAESDDEEEESSDEEEEQLKEIVKEETKGKF